MNDNQKQFILLSRQEGKSYGEIARELDLSLNTVKSYCMRNMKTPHEPTPAIETAAPKPVLEPTSVCRQCGAPLEQMPHRRQKQFCSDKCRLTWWHTHRDKAKGAEDHVCPVCGTAFIADAHRKYCSHSCYIKSRYA